MKPSERIQQIWEELIGRRTEYDEEGNLILNSEPSWIAAILKYLDEEDAKKKPKRRPRKKT